MRGSSARARRSSKVVVLLLLGSTAHARYCGHAAHLIQVRSIRTMASLLNVFATEIDSLMMAVFVISSPGQHWSNTRIAGTCTCSWHCAASCVDSRNQGLYGGYMLFARASCTLHFEGQHEPERFHPLPLNCGCALFSISASTDLRRCTGCVKWLCSSAQTTCTYTAAAQSLTHSPGATQTRTCCADRAFSYKTTGLHLYLSVIEIQVL